MIEEPAEWKNYKTLSINGKKRSLHEWRAHAQQQLQEGYGMGDLEEILEFVVDWSNTKDWIQTRTSGSTGRPKNIKIKKEHILESAKRTLAFSSAIFIIILAMPAVETVTRLGDMPMPYSALINSMDLNTLLKFKSGSPIPINTILVSGLLKCLMACSLIKLT